MSYTQFRCQAQDHTDHRCARPQEHEGACSYPKDEAEWKKFYAHEGESTDCFGKIPPQMCKGCRRSLGYTS